MEKIAKTHIDSLTIILHDDENQEWLDDIYQAFDGINLEYIANKSGRNHYEHSARLLHDGADFASVCWGGFSQKNTVMFSMMGTGCAQVKDWSNFVKIFQNLPKAKLTRLDIALDVFDGSLKLEEIYATRNEIAKWRNGKQGRPPAFKPIGDMCEKSRDGRTLYVGTRDSDIYTRIYEKGLQLFLKIANNEVVEDPRNMDFQLEEGSHPFKLGDYVRFEVEFKAKTTVLPLDALLNPDGYFAGAYPFAASLLKDVNPIQRLRLENIAMADLDSAIKHVRRQYGAILATAAQVYGAQAAWAMLVSNQQPSERLAAKGINKAKPTDAPRQLKERVDLETGEVITRLVINS
jgi:phage replication initiation protein